MRREEVWCSVQQASMDVCRTTRLRPAKEDPATAGIARAQGRRSSSCPLLIWGRRQSRRQRRLRDQPAVAHVGLIDERRDCDRLLCNGSGAEEQGTELLLSLLVFEMQLFWDDCDRCSCSSHWLSSRPHHASFRHFLHTGSFAT